VAQAEADTHVCEPERLLDYRMFQLRGEVAELEGALGEYLDSPQGRFARWLAEHERTAE
jgi:hypothetical protein